MPVVSSKVSGKTAIFSRVYKELCNNLNIKLAKDCPFHDKAFSNQTEGVVLGFRFNSVSLSWSFPERKADKLVEKIFTILTENKCNLKTIQELIGSLGDFSSMFPFAKAFAVQRPSALRTDLNFWSNLVDQSREGFPISPRPYLPPINSLHFTSDAAGVDLSLSEPAQLAESFGAASILAVFNNTEITQVSRIRWPDSFIFSASDSTGTRFAAKSSTLETIGVLLPFLSNPSLMAGRHVVLHVDNMAVVYGWEKKYVKNDIEASILIQALHILSHFLRCRVFVRHAPRMSIKMAILADHLSRSFSTSKEEENLAEVLTCPPKSRVLSDWLNHPRADWKLPLDLLEELKLK